jgi:hypothetical protein
MMDVLLNEDEEMLQASAREFFEQECWPRKSGAPRRLSLS